VAWNRLLGKVVANGQSLEAVPAGRNFALGRRARERSMWTDGDDQKSLRIAGPRFESGTASEAGAEANLEPGSEDFAALQQDAPHLDTAPNVHLSSVLYVQKQTVSSYAIQKYFHLSTPCCKTPASLTGGHRHLRSQQGTTRDA
jgi:hypothetical protein